ncbi:MAG TPA: hypothetical protein VGX76_11400 [Pirellulales bacterium]|nr:hypothetical protein [Pirellulales bacterium]
MAKPRHSVTLRIQTPVLIPWMSKKGATLELCDNDVAIAEIKVTGAHVYVRRAGKKKWNWFTFQDSLARLD